MPDLTDVFVYVAVFGFFFLFLRSLISLSKTDLKRPRKLTKATDEFYKDVGVAVGSVVGTAVGTDVGWSVGVEVGMSDGRDVVCCAIIACCS